MSDNEDEEQTFYYGTPLEPYDEDAFPKKRPIPLEDQVAKDAQGRRRFHGAFTGGFSAGFFNTVGSVQGWTPSEFKSSRSEKAENKLQKPADFMDEEDLGEFGIAPQVIRATKDYATNKKRKKEAFIDDGPIPGVPVLESLLQAGNETVGYFLIKNMNNKCRKSENSNSNETGTKVYGCVMPKNIPEEDNFNPSQYDVHEVYMLYLKSPKINTFGLGYVGLDKSHISLFEPTKLTVRERNNKKLSISGQAFGVGAFEDEDEDIYVKDNMSKYDFELSAEGASKSHKKKPENLILDSFVNSKQQFTPKLKYPPPVIPCSFTGKHKVKRSRFEPIQEDVETEGQTMNALIRARYIGEDSEQTQNASTSRVGESLRNEQPVSRSSLIKTEQVATSSGLIFDKFVSAKQEDDPTNILEEVKPCETAHGTKEMHSAVKLKMFGPLTHGSIPWKPCTMLCKRFNVPEQNLDELPMQKNKRTKHLIFQYQKHLDEEPPPYKPGLAVQTNSVKIETETFAPENVETQEETATDKKEEENKENEKDDDDDDNNKVLDLTDRVDVAKNTDLFKAVFLSSSESESEEEVNVMEKEKEKESFKANILSEPLFPKIKSTKEGILSNIDFSEVNSFKNNRTNHERPAEAPPANVEVARNDNTYGPKLPTASSTSFNLPAIEENDGNDEWVEKDSLSELHKKHKKRGKEKKKHKRKSKR